MNTRSLLLAAPFVLLGAFAALPAFASTDVGQERTSVETADKSADKSVDKTATAEKESSTDKTVANDTPDAPSAKDKPLELHAAANAVRSSKDGANDTPSKDTSADKTSKDKSSADKTSKDPKGDKAGSADKAGSTDKSGKDGAGSAGKGEAHGSHR